MRRNGTAREIQIAESFRRSFQIAEKSAAGLRTIITEIFAFRDRAVHPPAGMTEAVWHPRLQVGIEWRFVSFSADNAQAATGNALSLIAQLARRPKVRFKALAEYCKTVRSNVDPLLADWEAAHGALFDHPAATSD